MTDPLDPIESAFAGGGEASDPAVEEADTLLGQTLHDTYRIHRLVGEGGMGRVYEAHHTRIADKRFAVKVLRAELTRSPEVLARFQREAQAAATIHHPSVIGVHDFGHTPDGRPYLVADYLEGTELRAFVERAGRLDVELAVHIARRVCDAVQAAHVHGVIHRDLKPENVFLVGPPDRPVVKVLDFGLSRFMDARGGAPVTRAGVVMGTPSYMAPEQARGERGDHRVDVYGVGVLLYVALTGRPPFSEETPQQTLLAVMNQEPEPPRRHNPAIPEALAAIIQRAMARDPAARYPSAADLDAALLPFDNLERPLGARPAPGAAAAEGASGAGGATGPRGLWARVVRHRAPTVLVLPVALLVGVVIALPAVLGRGERAPSASPAPSAGSGRPTAGRTARTDGVAIAPLDAPSAGSAGASALELEAANRGGVAALEALVARYPADPPGLEALAIACSREPARQVRSVEVLRRLFAADPARASRKEVRDVVLRLALGRGAAGEPALDLMAQAMGGPGADLLYDLFVTSPELRDAARKRLDDPAVKAHMSPALAVTYALRVAPSCDARLPLLERAAAVGDERTIGVLRGLTLRTERGCGPRRNRPCAAACPADAARFEATVTEIQRRLAAAAR